MSIDPGSKHWLRRGFLQQSGLGFGALAAAWMQNAQAAPAGNPLSSKKPPLPATAKNVIFLFMHGGPSHMETFDPKPALNKLHGQLVPASFGHVQLQFSKFNESPVLGCKRTFRKYGEAGMDISDLFPHVASQADKLAVIRSMNHDGFTHTAALNWLNNGWPRLGRPSLGSWLVYGLGSESESLPAFVVMLEGGIKSGSVVYSSGFLPAVYQGTPLRPGPSPILNLKRPADMTQTQQRDWLNELRWFNEQHRTSREDETALDARISSYELAFKMQMAAPELTDLGKETAAARALYGIGDKTTDEFGSKCLLARRLVERGVRFVQLWSGSTTGGEDWDGHKQCDANHQRMAAKTDKPIAGLLADLAGRGLLDSTLVIWGGEFGRTPTSDGNMNGGGDSQGRDHNPYGFTIWMAGGGVKGGRVIGATDEIGLRAVQDPVHVHDLHASILAMMGMDHTKLTYPFQGRDFRLTDVHGKTDLVAKLRSTS
ncbi:MAG: DUF1501 domain-containing protein [Candidatus Solibacter usitatus]|nr:DUF1501 domain-containing protein [Candidatus Solibacter usitatus]